MEYKKFCKNCGKEFIAHKSNTICCCHKCIQEYTDNINRKKRCEELLNNGVEGVDYVIDLWNNLPTPRIYGKWMKVMHPGKTSEDYKKEFPGAPLYCSKDKENTSKNSGKFMKSEEYRKKYSERFKGEHNPNHSSHTTKQQRKERSPFSKEFYVKRNLSEEDRTEFIKTVRSSVISNTNINYYLNKNYSQEEAEKLLKERQSTNTIKNYIKKYGEELGSIKFKERNEQWSKLIELKYKNNEFSKLPHNLGAAYSKKELKLFNDLTKYLKISINDCFCVESDKNQLCLFSKDEKRKYYYDFAYNNKIIEFNGDFWHANPKLYEENYINPFNNLTAKEIWKKEKNKITCAKNYNYQVLVIWESEYENDYDNCIKKCVNFLND